MFGRNGMKSRADEAMQLAGQALDLIETHKKRIELLERRCTNATPDPSQSVEHKDIWEEIERMWGAIDAILDHLHMDLEMAPTLKERKGAQ